MLSWLLDTAGFPTRWDCGRWTNELGVAHIGSDVALFLANAALMLVLALMFRRTTDRPSSRALRFACVFLLCTAAIHVFDALMFWAPLYRLAAAIKVAAVLVSWTLLFSVLPDLMRVLRSPSLFEVNRELEHEVTARRNIEARLRRSEARYRSLVDATCSVLWVTDARGEIGFPQAAWQSFTGQGFEAARGLGWLASIHHDDRPGFASEWQSGIAGVRAFESEARFYHAERATHRACLVRAAPVLGEQGKVEEWVISLNDIEDKRQAERERREIERRAQESQRMESLGVLAGGVAHDFNNLLVGVMGHAEWISRRVDPGSPLQDNLQRIVATAERAAQLCKQMLAYAGRGRFLVEPCHVSSIAKDMHALLTSLAPPGTRLVVNAQAGLAPVEADPGELRQVLISLVTNSAEALEHRASGTITVNTGSRYFSASELARTKLGSSCAEGEYVFVEVRDDGPGIPADVLPRIFDPFFSTKFMGRGLSLAAVLGIARSHHGTIDVTSAPGQGTRVRVLLPALLAGAAASRTPPPLSRRADGTVLVVDDDEEVRELARLTLEDAGAKVLVASSGEQALEVFAARQASIDVVLLDLTMPGMDGATTLRALRALDPALRVVLTSGYPASDAIKRIGEPPVDGFVQKPWRPSELVSKLSSVLSYRNSNDAFRCA